MNTYSRTRSISSRRRGRQTWRALAIPLGVAAVCVWALYAFSPSSNPSSFKDVRIFDDGLHVRIDRTSPAYAALEDALLEENLTKLNLSSESGSTIAYFLAADERSIEPLVAKIQRDNAREVALMAQARAAKEAAARALAQAIFGGGREEEKEVEKPVAAVIEPRVSEPSREVAADSWGDAEVYHHPVQTISLSDLQMSREELAQSLLVPLAVVDQDPDQVTRIVATLNESAREDRWYATAGKKVGGLNPRSSQKKNREDARSEGLDAHANKTFTDVRHQVAIAGSIEFVDGLALTNGNDQVIVYRESDGEVLERGPVWLREGRYEIFVERTEGDLVAELRTPSGEVLGRGIYSLEELPPFPVNQYRVDRIAIKIRPLPHGISGHVIAAPEKERTRLPLASAQVSFYELPELGSSRMQTQKDGFFEAPDLMEYSNLIAKTQRLGYWGSTKWTSVGSSAELPMFSESFMKSILVYARSQNISVPEGSAMIWGRVSRNGQAVAGAKADLMTVEDEYKPIYFNESMQPDSSLSSTSNTGFYAFIGVPSGAHAVQVDVGNRSTPPRLLLAEARSVSVVDVEVGRSRRMKVKAFDAFRTDWPLMTRLTAPGASSSVTIPRSGEGFTLMEVGSHPQIYDADAGLGYERVRVTVHRDQRAIYVPMIQSSWLEQVFGTLRLNRDLGTGTIIGFVQGQNPYRVSMELKEQSPNSRLLYFNSRGEVTKNNHGEPGGGFILINVKEGFRTITIQSVHSQQILASTVLVESKVTNVLSRSIR